VVDHLPSVQEDDPEPDGGMAMNLTKTKLAERQLGTSQKAVFDWLKDHPNSTSQDVGDAIYDTTSGCAIGYPHEWPIVKVRRFWAAKLLYILVKKGLVERFDVGIYRVVPEEE